VVGGRGQVGRRRGAGEGGKIFFLRFFGEGQTVSYLCTPKTKTGDQIWKRVDGRDRKDGFSG